jgi:hypothetical protein
MPTSERLNRDRLAGTDVLSHVLLSNLDAMICAIAIPLVQVVSQHRMETQDGGDCNDLNRDRASPAVRL